MRPFTFARWSSQTNDCINKFALLGAVEYIYLIRSIIIIIIFCSSNILKLHIKGSTVTVVRNYYCIVVLIACKSKYKCLNHYICVQLLQLELHEVA